MVCYQKQGFKKDKHKQKLINPKFNLKNIEPNLTFRYAFLRPQKHCNFWEDPITNMKNETNGLKRYCFKTKNSSHRRYTHFLP